MTLTDGKGGITQRWRSAIDLVQRRHRWIAFPVAVIHKLKDDAAGRHVALLSFWGLVSLFPFLLVLLSVFGFVLESDPALQTRIVSTLAADIPIVGPQVRADVTTLTGSSTAIALGLIGATWGAMAVADAFQFAMDEVWRVPKQSRAGFWRTRVSALAVMATLALVLVGVAVLASGSVAGAAGPWTRVAGLALSTAAVFAVLMVVLRVFAGRRLTWQQVLPGALVGVILMAGVHAIAGVLLRQVVQNAGSAYGAFATIIGLIVWLQLQFWVVMISAEVNAVSVLRLWPRLLTSTSGATPSSPAR
ncbi:MAG: YihY/virulence factor BrkB family protein [Nocardioides sp.]